MAQVGSTSCHIELMISTPSQQRITTRLWEQVHCHRISTVFYPKRSTDLPFRMMLVPPLYLKFFVSAPICALNMVRATNSLNTPVSYPTLFYSDPNRGHLLEAGFPQATVSLLEGYAEHLPPQPQVNPLSLSISHLQVIKTAIGFLLNSSLGYGVSHASQTRCTLVFTS